MGKSGEKIKGFLCQSRTAVDKYETSGALMSGDSSLTTKNNCQGVRWNVFEAYSNSRSLFYLIYDRSVLNRTRPF